MKKTIVPTLTLALAFSLTACGGASSDSGGSAPGSENSGAPATTPASTDTASPAFLSEIGKPLTALMQKYPAGEFLHAGAIQCYGVSSEEYSYFIYRSPFAPIEGLPDYSDLNCAGIATTMGELFPPAADGMSFADFFSMEGVENYGYNADFLMSFTYNGLSGELHLPVGEDIPADNDTIDPNYPVMIFDESINAANIALVDQFYEENGYPTGEDVDGEKWDVDDVYWGGTYNSDVSTKLLLIRDYDGKAFGFEISDSGSTFAEGTAALDPEYPNYASGGGFAFEMYPGNTGVAVDGADGFAENFSRMPPGMLGETE